MIRNWSCSLCEQTRVFTMLKKLRLNSIVDYAVALSGYVFALYPSGQIKVFNPYTSVGKIDHEPKWGTCECDLYNSIQELPISIILARNSIKYPTVIGERGCCIWKKQNTEEKIKYNAFKVFEGNFTGGEWSDDGKILALWSCFSSTFLLFDIATLKSKEYSISKGGIASIHIGHLKRFIVICTTENYLKIFDPVKLCWEQWLIDGGISCLYISKDENHILVVQNKTSIIYHLYSNGYYNEEGKSPIDQFVLLDMYELSHKKYFIDKSTN